MAYGIRDKYNNTHVHFVFLNDKRLSDYLFQIIINSMINIRIILNHKMVF